MLMPKLSADGQAIHHRFKLCHALLGGFGARAQPIYFGELKVNDHLHIVASEDDGLIAAVRATRSSDHCAAFLNAASRSRRARWPMLRRAASAIFLISRWISAARVSMK